MEKKELILTVAKDLLISTNIKITGPVGEKQLTEIGNRLSSLVKQVEKVYGEIEGD